MGLTESAGGTVDRAAEVAGAAPAAEDVTGTAARPSGKEAQASDVSRIARPANERGLGMGDDP